MSHFVALTIGLKAKERSMMFDANNLRKFEHAISSGMSVSKACNYAGFNKIAYYDYIKKHPEYYNRIKELSNNILIKARAKIKYNGGSMEDKLNEIKDQIKILSSQVGGGDIPQTK